MEKYKIKDILGITFFALGIICLIYMFLTPLNHVIMHMDEYFTLTLTTLPLSDIITITSSDVHPPVYYILAKGVAQITEMTGADPLSSLRVLSIIPYIIILVISAVKIRKDYGLFTAGLFAFAMAVMSEFFQHFLIIRMYSWAILFLLIAFLAFKEIIETQDIKAWIVLTVFSVLCAYTHYFAAISAICLYLTLLAYLLKFKRDKIKIWGISTAAAIALYLPWTYSLLTQLNTIHGSYWITQVNHIKLINALGYFAYSNETAINAIAILILIAIISIYSKHTTANEKDKFIIKSGFSIYLGTIILPILISVIFQPILVVRYLLPATAVLWLTISILVTKIEDKKMFMISVGLIGLLLISGVVATIHSNEGTYYNGICQTEILNNITEDPNSMLIITNKNMIMYFLDYANKTDMYCLDVSPVFGESMDQLHTFYDFKTFKTKDLNSLIADNADKNIYIISWGDPAVNQTTVPLNSEAGMIFSKVNTTNNVTTNR